MKINAIIQDLKTKNEGYKNIYFEILKRDDDFLRRKIEKGEKYKSIKGMINPLNQTALAEAQRNLKNEAIGLLIGLKVRAPEIENVIDNYKAIPNHEKRYSLGIDNLINEINKDLDTLKNIDFISV